MEGISTNKVEQDDMPVAESPGGKAREFSFTAFLYRLYSADRQRSELYYRPTSVGRFGYDGVKYHLASVERPGHVLMVTAAGMALLVASACIEAVPDPENHPDDEDEMLEPGFRAGRVRVPVGGRWFRVADNGNALSSRDGALPGLVHANEVTIGHLEGIAVPLNVSGRDARLIVDPSPHCWTSKPDDGFHGGPVILDEYGQRRQFSPKRHRLSKSLPDMFRNVRNIRVFRAERSGHFGMYVANGNQPNAYVAYFTFEKRRPGDPADTLRVKVRSAYVKRKPSHLRWIDIEETLENLLRNART